MRCTTVSDEVRQRFHAQLLTVLPKQLADELMSHHTAVYYAKDALLFLRGSPADLTFWILSGLVRTYYPTPDGERSVVRICGPGDLLGYADWIASDGRRVQAQEAQAMTRCTVALFTREHAIRTLQKLEPAELIRLFEYMNSGWSSIAMDFARFLGFSFRERLEATLDDLAKRFGVEDKRGTLLRIKLSHGDLAEMVDASRPMVTRLMGEMIADHRLYREGKQYILPAKARSANKITPLRPHEIRLTAKPSDNHRNGAAQGARS
ncbi:MAG: Crp/Fnr family transcriptional regulator [Candidatus Binataceae bacterium]|nr:Crp/Fnr family transcriptional regulator [Candidatus Binataceae bacterium]